MRSDKPWVIVPLILVAAIVAALVIAVACGERAPEPAAEDSCCATSYPFPFSTCCEVFADRGGSATIADIRGNRGLLISCAHLFKDGTTTARIRFRGKRLFEATLLAVDRKHDLSAMVVDVPVDSEHAAAPRAAAKQDFALTAIGFPHYDRNGGPHYTIGRFQRYDGHLVRFDTDIHAHAGFSGGGIFTEDCEFVGVLKGYSKTGGYSYGASGEPFVKFVNHWKKAEWVRQPTPAEHLDHSVLVGK